MAPASRKTSQDHFFTPQSILLEIALFFQTLYFVVCFIMCVCMYVLSLLHLHCLSWIYIISIVDRGPTVGPTDGHGPGLFDLCTVAVRSRSGYLGLTAVHGPLKSSGPAATLTPPPRSPIRNRSNPPVPSFQTYLATGQEFLFYTSVTYLF